MAFFPKFEAVAAAAMYVVSRHTAFGRRIGVGPYLNAAFKGAIIIGAVLLQRKDRA